MNRISSVPLVSKYFKTTNCASRSRK